VNVARLYDELGRRVRLRLPHHFIEFRVVATRLEALVPLFFGRIAPDIDESVFSTDAQFGIALHRDPVTHIRDPMPSENSGRAVCKTLRERIPLPGLRRIHTQLEEPGGLPLLRVAP